MATYKGVEISLKPTEAMAEEAQRGLDWRKEHGRGGTEVGVARARQLINKQELSADTVRRMHSYFSRHEVDKQGEGFTPDEDGYPSAGRIAWALWGGDAGQTWARAKDAALDKIDEGDRALSGSALEGVKNKVEEHNEEYGDTASKRVTVSMLSKVYERGIGAYKTNPESVRPSVSSPEQWAMARVNSFLYAVRNGRFRSGKHDTDLLPDGHPMKSKDERAMENRHIQSIEETDDAYIITFGKSMMDERPYHDDEEEDKERVERADLVHRAMGMDEKAVDEKTRTAMVGVSSEEPVKRDFGMEVIDHTKASMNLEFLNSGRAPLLLDHDMERQIGVVESVELDEDARRLRAKVRFGKGELASEVFNDVADGIRQNISVGYRVDQRVRREGDADDIYRVATTPMEISIVSIPADQSSLVGVGRSNSETLKATSISDERNDEMSEVDLDAVRQEAAKAAQKNAAEVMTLARKHNKADLGNEALKRGLSIDEFRGELLDAIGSDPIETPAHVVDMPKKEKREYSFGNLIRAQLNHDWKNAGFEREMHEEIAMRLGKQSDGFYVPDFAWRAGAMATGATGASASENVVDNFIPTVHRGDMFIEALRARQVMSNLGVTFMGGLTNRIKIPKFSAGANAGFVEELGNVTDQSQTDAAVTLTPKTLGAYVDIGRLALKESIPQLDNVVQDDLLRSIADRIEYHAINGDGTGGAPTGLVNANITSVDISTGTDVDALTWADVVALVKAVEDNNAVVNAQAQGWLSSPAVKAKLASTAKVGSTDSVMLMEAPWNELYGYPIEFTSNVLSTYDPGDAGNDASALFFGDFSQLLVGLFGAPSIIVDETTGGLAGTVRIIVHQDVDIAFRNLESFAKTDEISIV